jgi:hypothetical protein
MQAQIDDMCASFATPAASGRRQGQRFCDRLMSKAMTAATIKLRPAALARLLRNYGDVIEFVEVCVRVRACLCVCVRACVRSPIQPSTAAHSCRRLAAMNLWQSCSPNLIDKVALSGDYRRLSVQGRLAGRRYREAVGC